MRWFAYQKHISILWIQLDRYSMIRVDHPQEVSYLPNESSGIIVLDVSFINECIPSEVSVQSKREHIAVADLQAKITLNLTVSSTIFIMF